jgi:hypothetical protein
MEESDHVIIRCTAPADTWRDRGKSQNTLTRLSVTRDEVCIDNWIYWTVTLVTTNNYDSLAELHTPKSLLITAHMKSS